MVAAAFVVALARARSVLVALTLAVAMGTVAAVVRLVVVAAKVMVAAARWWW
jgi:hypothetical protein